MALCFNVEESNSSSSSSSFSSSSNNSSNSGNNSNSCVAISVVVVAVAIIIAVVVCVILVAVAVVVAVIAAAFRLEFYRRCSQARLMAAPGLAALLAFAAALGAEGEAQEEEEVDDRRLLQRARARTAREAKKSKRLAQERDAAVTAKGVIASDLALCTALQQDCLRWLSDAVKRQLSPQLAESFVRMWAFQRLACSARVKGAGAERQRMAQELVANAALTLQKRWWANGLAHAVARVTQVSANRRNQDVVEQTIDFSSYLGLRLVWDEAGHKMKPLLSQASVATQKAECDVAASAVVQVLTATCDLFGVCSVSDRASNRAASFDRWQPWLCPPRPLLNTSADFVLEALLTMLPFPLDDRSSLQAVMKGCDALFVVLLCDSASSNIRLCRYLVHVARQLGMRLIIHVEVCSVHQVHIIRSGSFELVGCAGVLYSLSKIMRISTALDAFRLCLLATVQQVVTYKLCETSARRPSPFWDVVKTIFGIDGSESFLFKKGLDGNLEPTEFYKTLQALTEDIEFLPDGKVVVLFPDDAFHRRLSASQLRRAAVDKVTEPAIVLFIKRCWNAAALSRWTHITESLKRVVLGCAMGRILPRSLAAMSVHLKLDEASLDVALAKARAIEDKGGDPGVQQAWARHGKRILRISSYFGQANQSVAIGCLLIAITVVDNLHHGIIGHARKNRATLTSMAHPFRSIVGSALQKVLTLLEHWAMEDACPWHLLEWLGWATSDQAKVRLLARRTLIRLSCGLFRRLELRFAGWPYKLVWLLLAVPSPSAAEDEQRPTDDDVDFMCTSLLQLDEHCLPVSALHFRKLFPSNAAMKQPKAREVVRTMQAAMGFATDEVERENAHVARGVKSQGQSRQHNVVVNEQVCRKLKEAHLLKGGSDPSTTRAAPSVVDTCDGALSSGLLLDVPQLPPALPLASVAGQSSARPSPASAKANAKLAPVRLPKRHGNPKMAYVNNLMSMTSCRDGAMAKAHWLEQKREFGEKFDSLPPEEQDRWRHVFKIQGVARPRTTFGMSRRKRKACGSGKVALVRSKPKDFRPLWQNNGVALIAAQHKVTQSEAMPIDEHTLQVLFDELYKGQLTELRQACGGKSKHSLDGAVPARCSVLDSLAHGDQIRLWGCGSCWANVCSKLKCILFVSITGVLSSWVDGLKERRDLVEDGLVLLGRETSDGIISKVLFVILGMPVLNPKVQVFLLCAPSGYSSSSSSDAGVFSSGLPDLPFELRLLTRPSLLSCPSRCGFRTLHHLTSDDLALLLVGTRLKHWSARQIRPSVKDCPNLMEMVLGEFIGDEFSLSHRANKRKTTPAATRSSLSALSCLALECPLAQGRAAAQVGRNRAADGGGGGARLTLAADLRPLGVLDDFALVDAFPATVCESLADLVLDATVVEAGGVLFDGEQEDEEPEAEGDRDVEADELVATAVDVIDPAPASASSSSFDLDDYVVGDGGKVTHRLYPDTELGNIKIFGKKGESIICVCYRHRYGQCRILRSTRNVSQRRMLLWLVQGQVLSDKATVSDHVVAGAEHKRKFTII